MSIIVWLVSGRDSSRHLLYDRGERENQDFGWSLDFHCQSSRIFPLNPCMVLLPLVVYHRVSGRSPFTIPVVRPLKFVQNSEIWWYLTPQFVHFGFDTRSLQPNRFGFTGCFGGPSLRSTD